MMGLLCRSVSSSPRNSENLVSQNVFDVSPPRLSSYRTPSPEELRKEIASLELEILRLEWFLLSLYRKALEEQVPSFLSHTGTTSPCTHTSSPIQFCDKLDHKPEKRSGFPAYRKTFACPRSIHADLKALPARERSLGDLLGNSHIVDNPNKLSEDIIRCISSVYCTLFSSTRTDSDFSASPPSSSIFSSMSLHCNEDNTLNQRSEDILEVNVSSGVIIERLKIHLDDGSFNCIALMLKNFRSLVQNLEKVDPSGLKREEKLAFWINVHNALVMHAYLAYGIHSRSRNSLILKAQYDVGAYRVSPCIIQSSILGIRPHDSQPLLQTLFSPSRKSKTCSIRHVYALEYPEPLVHFALASGKSTDPQVRVYTADCIFRDLRQAKEEFIRNNVGTHKGTKILLPKIIDYYMNDMSLDMSGFLRATTGCLSEAAKRITQKSLKDKKNKYVKWLPEKSDFRYVIAEEVAKGRIKR